MDKKKILKYSLIGVFSIAMIGGGIAYYMYNMPHRDIQSTKADFSTGASDIVAEYLANAEQANDKYLDGEGESKILEIKGTVAKTEEDYEGNTVVLLKSPEDKAGVSCTFLASENEKLTSLDAGDIITVKGVIRSGAAFDADLDMYENVIVEKCSLVSK